MTDAGHPSRDNPDNTAPLIPFQRSSTDGQTPAGELVREAVKLMGYTPEDALLVVKVNPPHRMLLTSLPTIHNKHLIRRALRTIVPTLQESGAQQVALLTFADQARRGAGRSAAAVRDACVYNHIEVVANLLVIDDSILEQPTLPTPSSASTDTKDQ